MVRIHTVLPRAAIEDAPNQALKSQTGRTGRNRIRTKPECESSRVNLSRGDYQTMMSETIVDLIINAEGGHIIGNYCTVQDMVTCSL